MVDVEEPDERREDVEEVLHAVDVATLGMLAEPLFSWRSTKSRIACGQVVGVALGVQEPVRGNVGVEGVTDAESERPDRREARLRRR